MACPGFSPGSPPLPGLPRRILQGRGGGWRGRDQRPGHVPCGSEVSPGGLRVVEAGGRGSFRAVAMVMAVVAVMAVMCILKDSPRGQDPMPIPGPIQSKPASPALTLAR
jgi:hypothetical protein